MGGQGWMLCDDDLQKIIEDAYKKKPIQPILYEDYKITIHPSYGGSYEIHFYNNTQRNIKTDYTRTIRRFKPFEEKDKVNCPNHKCAVHNGPHNWDGGAHSRRFSSIC